MGILYVGPVPSDPNDVSPKSYVDLQDSATLGSAKAYADQAIVTNKLTPIATTTASAGWTKIASGQFTASGQYFSTVLELTGSSGNNTTDHNTIRLSGLLGSAPSTSTRAVVGGVVESATTLPASSWRILIQSGTATAAPFEVWAQIPSSTRSYAIAPTVFNNNGATISLLTNQPVQTAEPTSTSGFLGIISNETNPIYGTFPWAQISNVPTGTTTASGIIRLATVSEGTAGSLASVAATPASVKAYADAGDSTTLSSAKTYSDSGDSTTLASAKAYADAKPAGGVTSVATRTGDVVLAKADVGLGNVDNTADTAKPVSTAQKTYIDAQDAKNYTKPSTGIPATDLASAVQTSLGKADTALQSAPVTSVASRTGAVTLSKSDVGLANVDNTADTAKPISTAQQTALNAKAATATTISPGTGLQGGGDLSANRTISLSAAAQGSIALVDAALPQGGRLGPASKDISGLDLNLIYENGFYNGQNMTNAPLGATTWFLVQVMSYSGGPQAYITQQAVSFTGTVNKVYQRTRDGSAWSAWEELTSGYFKPSTGIPYSDLNSGVATSIRDALLAYNDGRYAPATNFYSWSYANTSAGAGGGGVSIDSTAAANVPRNTTAKVSEGYVAIGRDALGAATRARNCIAIGSNALGLGNPGFGNLAIGVFALANVQGTDEYAATSVGTRNIGIGSLAGYFVSSGYMNTFMGRDAGQTVTTGYYNTALGYRAGTSGIAPISLDGGIQNQYPVTAIANTTIGMNAGALLAASNNTIVGASAAQNLRNSVQNVVIGQYAANSLGSTSSENSLLLNKTTVTGTYAQSGTTITVTATSHGAVAGNKVLIQFTSGGISTVTTESQWLTVASVTSANVFTITSPVSLTTSGNVSITSVETATASVVGGQNTIVGQNAMSGAATSGGNQAIFGESAGITSTGARNTIIGSRAGYNLTTATDNTHVGYNAGRALSTGGGQTTESNTTALGSGSTVSGANQVQLGNSTTTTYVYGTVQNRSDIRDKADVRDTKLGLEFVNKLRPVDYRWDMREDYIEFNSEGEIVRREKDGSKKRTRYHHGLIAQEVEEVVEETGLDFGGLQDHSKDGGADVMSIGYDELISPLIKAVQELTGQVSELKSKIQELENKQSED